MLSPIVPTPSASTIGRVTYAMRYESTDPTKYCTPLYGPGSPQTETYLQVDVNARPAKPSIPAQTLTYCQNQSAEVLTANTDVNASLVWYGTNATSGTATTTAPRPATGQVGTFKYYVAQSQGGCEGERAEITVQIKPIPALPVTANAISFCQNTPTEALKADGTGLAWFEGARRLANAPTPVANTPGTVSYFVTQTVDGCESGRAEVRITTKRTPDAPGTLARAICQNETAPLLTATGQNLLWYSANSGGTGSGTAPTVNSGVAAQTTYYVAQMLDGCEGPRAALLVTVKPLPAAPGVTKVDLCQFANAAPLVATGSGLTWFDTDGKSLGQTSPTPPTGSGATLSYQVNQTLDGCAGPKATLVVSVQTTPLPALPKTRLELCKGSATVPLEATGTGLKWTDPTGAVSTTAPVPSTAETSKNPDGDAYFVTQTGSTGCESPRATIRVFVQGPPTLALSGATTVNLGVEASLALTFTGVGPYQYKLLAGTAAPLSGTAVKDTTIRVLPDRTTIFQVSEVSNRCGVGLPVSTATVVVLVPTIRTASLASATICAGTLLPTTYQTTGQFNMGSVFKVQLARFETDSTKIQYADLTTNTASDGQITGGIPLTATAGTYLVRVVATNPKIPILGVPSATLLTIRPRPSATVTASAPTLFAGETLKLSVSFQGEGPWQFSYRDSSSVANTVTNVPTNANPHILELKPQQPTVYRLTALRACWGIEKYW